MNELIFNSRPMNPISSDVNDISSLKPGHFSISDSFTTLSEHDFQSLPYKLINIQTIDL